MTRSVLIKIQRDKAIKDHERESTLKFIVVIMKIVWWEVLNIKINKIKIKGAKIFWGARRVIKNMGKRIFNIGLLF